MSLFAFYVNGHILDNCEHWENTLVRLPFSIFLSSVFFINAYAWIQRVTSPFVQHPPRISLHAFSHMRFEHRFPLFYAFFFSSLLRPAFSHCSFRCNNEYITLRAREYGWNVSNKRETDTRVPFVGRPVGRSKCQLEKGDNAFFETKGNENCSSTKRDSVLLSGSLIRDATPHYL